MQNAYAQSMMTSISSMIDLMFSLSPLLAFQIFEDMERVQNKKAEHARIHNVEGMALCDRMMRIYDLELKNLTDEL